MGPVGAVVDVGTSAPKQYIDGHTHAMVTIGSNVGHAVQIPQADLQQWIDDRIAAICIAQSLRPIDTASVLPELIDFKDLPGHVNFKDALAQLNPPSPDFQDFWDGCVPPEAKMDKLEGCAIDWDACSPPEANVKKFTEEEESWKNVRAEVKTRNFIRSASHKFIRITIIVLLAYISARLLK